jgi:hypothetical protein
MDAAGELALVRRGRITSLVDVASEHDEVDIGCERTVNGLVERVQKIV